MKKIKQIPFDFESEDGLWDALKTCKDREQEIFCLYFGFREDRQHTLKEIAKIYSISPARAGQIKAKVLRRLEHKSRVAMYKPSDSRL